MPKALHVRVLFRGKQLRSKTFRRERIVIGRDPECDLHLFNVGVSRHHALIEGLEGRYSLRDLGSSNGTYAGDRKIELWPIEDGDKIRIGKFELVFNLVDAPMEGHSKETDRVTGFSDQMTMSLAED
jgi:pSer/pThr/pTyr-binding forkhead associated (FHA) protein